MRVYLYKLKYILILVSIIVTPLKSYSNDVSIITSNSDELHFTVNINPTRLDFREVGKSAVSYYKIISFAIPPNATAEVVSVNQAEELPFQNNLISKQAISGKLYEMSSVKVVRNYKTASIILYPVNGNSYYSQIDVTIRFSRVGNQPSSRKDNSKFDNILKSLLINFDQIGQIETKPDKTKPSFASYGQFNESTEWYKIRVSANGIYRITGSDLANAGLLGTINSDDIHIYNGGGLPLEVFNEYPRSEFKELSIVVEDGGDGILDGNDYLFFYGESALRWFYSDTSEARYVNNPYESNNIYWLTISNSTSGLRMTHFDGSMSGVGGSIDTTITEYRRYLHVEQDNILRRTNDGKIEDYYNWYWSNDDNLNFFIETSGRVIGDTANIRLVGRTLDTTGFIDDIGYIDLLFNNQVGLEKVCNQFECSYRVVNLNNGSNEVDLSLMSNQSAEPHFNYMELNYLSDAVPLNNKLDLTIGNTIGTASIEVINNFSSQPFIFDITEPRNPFIIDNSNVQGNLLVFHDILSNLEFNRYYLTIESEFLSPTSIQQTFTNEIATINNQADLIVVTPQLLIPALDEYINYRQTTGYSIRITSVEDIMDNFSFGMYDPTAIRDYLKYEYENSPAPAPSAVLFVGDANYDFKQKSGSTMPNYVPAYIHQYDNSSSDDNYVYFGDYGLLDSDTSFIGIDRGFDMIVSRWPVRTSREISIITNKLKSYEASDNFGIWRNNITLVSDDEFGTFNNETFHTIQTELLSNSHIPDNILRNKIYLWEYPFVNNEKPAVNDQIVNSINNGTLLVNYVGHGNPDIWAHESVFTRDGDLPRLDNSDKLSLFFAASCAIGFFDDPIREGMAEALLSMENGGAIGVISATRLVFSSENAVFNRKVFDVLLNNKDLSICEAVYTAKLERQYLGNNPQPITNDRNYLLFGDPFVKLGKPQLSVEYTSLPDTLIALGQSSVSGRVIDNQDNLYSAEGLLSINVFDSERMKTFRLIQNGQVIQSIDYNVDGAAIFKGTASIASGNFMFDFVSPLDINFGGEGAKILSYASFDNIDASGLASGIKVADSIGSSNDSLGPNIEISFASVNNFQPGDFISNSDLLQVFLSDQSGINLSGGIGHGITLEIDNNEAEIINLTNLFNYNLDDYTNGQLEYQLTGLPVGTHNFKLKAWDNANNSASTEFNVEILGGHELAIEDLLNYPNPMKEMTTFSFYITQPVENFVLDIFTLSGRKIMSFERQYQIPGFYDDIIWYGKDFYGDRVATEVYIYKATAYPVSGGDKVESFGKVILVN
jgi:hypothetical protein